MQTRTRDAPAIAAASSGARSARGESLLAAALAAVLGAVIVGIVGFAHLDVLHDAAHDVRHTNGFPCH
jgi:cobalt transporter subunit CbtB